MIAVNLLVAHALRGPREDLRSAWNIAWIAVQVRTVAHNVGQGLP